METKHRLLFATTAIASLFALGTFSPAKADVFESTEVNPNNFIAIAVPYGSGNYQLLVLEQLSSRRACWNENGSDPVRVEPLLLNFDFTNICGRSTDSNGYSIRMGNTDMGQKFDFNIVKGDGELLLVGSNLRDRSIPPIRIGSTKGMTSGFMKFILEPGWRFAKRTYQGRMLGHIYLTNDAVASSSGSRPTRLLPLPQVPIEPPLEPPVREVIFTKPGAAPPATRGSVPTTRPETRPLPQKPTSRPRVVPTF